MPKQARTTTRDEPKKAPGLFLLCAEVMYAGSHHVFVEVVSCRGGKSHTTYCPECAGRRFYSSRSKWRSQAKTESEVRASQHFTSIYLAL